MFSFCGRKYTQDYWKLIMQFQNECIFVTNYTQISGPTIRHIFKTLNPLRSEN